MNDTTHDHLHKILTQGLLSLSLRLNDHAQQQLIDYVLLLVKWNKTQNLTATVQPEAVMTRHVLDCLALVDWFDQDKILDVGSGSGLPGIPLAIARPTMTVHLLETRLKRVVFLRQCVRELALENVQVLHTRLENYHPDQTYPAIIARAFCPPSDYFTRVQRLLDSNGQAAMPLGHHAIVPAGLGQVHTLENGGLLWVITPDSKPCV